MRLCLNMLIFSHNLGNWLIVTSNSILNLYSQCPMSDILHLRIFWMRLLA